MQRTGVQKLNKVYLGLGSNLGDRKAYLQKALNELAQIGIISQKSEIKEYPSWGISQAPNYLNMAILLETQELPLSLISKILKIEENLGRKRVEKWGSRVIDIDILFYNDWIINTSKLNIPHPYIVERLFVLKPLMELDKEMEHPVYRQKIAQLYQKCIDESNS